MQLENITAKELDRRIDKAIKDIIKSAPTDKQIANFSSRCELTYQKDKKFYITPFGREVIDEAGKILHISKKDKDNIVDESLLRSKGRDADMKDFYSGVLSNLSGRTLMYKEEMSSFLTKKGVLKNYNSGDTMVGILFAIGVDLHNSYKQ